MLMMSGVPLHPATTDGEHTLPVRERESERDRE